MEVEVEKEMEFQSDFPQELVPARPGARVESPLTRTSKMFVTCVTAISQLSCSR